jgi:hypothetical protein
MTSDDPLPRLVAAVDVVRRRANRRILVEAVSLGLLPAAGVAILVAALTRLAGAAPDLRISAAIGVVGLAVGVALHRRRRLDRAGAALLLDRRAGTDERCVTGLRTGGDVAADALARLDDATVRRACAFRPPPVLMAAVLAVGALLGLHLLPAFRPAELPRSSILSEILQPRAPGGDGGGGEPGEDPPEGPPPTEEEVRRLVMRAEAPLPEGPVADEVAEARRALERGDDEEARRRLEKAIERALAEREKEGGEGGDVRRLRDALRAAGGRASATSATATPDEVDWGEDADLVKRYLLGRKSRSR